MSIINCPFALDLKLNTSMGVLKNWLKLFHNGFSIGGGWWNPSPPRGNWAKNMLFGIGLKACSTYYF